MPLLRPPARRALAALVGAAALAACSKDPARDITAPAPSVFVKFFNFGVGAPNVNFYANDAKLTAANSTACTPLPTGATALAACQAAGTESPLGTGSGASAAGGFYVGTAPGQYTFTARLSDTATANRGVVVASSPAAVADGKRYSMYLSGIYNPTAKTSDAFIVEDALPATIAPTQAYVRLVNAISNSSPLTLYAKSTDTGSETAVGTAQAYKSAGAFVALPGGTYDLGARVAGATANAVARTGVSFDAGRVYTVTARGDFTVTSSTAANRSQLDNTANR